MSMWEEMAGELICTFEHIQAYSTKLIDIGVVDFSKKSYLWWRHGIIVWEEELEFKNASYLWIS